MGWRGGDEGGWCWMGVVPDLVGRSLVCRCRPSSFFGNSRRLHRNVDSGDGSGRGELELVLGRWRLRGGFTLPSLRGVLVVVEEAVPPELEGVIWEVYCSRGGVHWEGRSGDRLKGLGWRCRLDLGVLLGGREAPEEF